MMRVKGPGARVQVVIGSLLFLCIVMIVVLSEASEQTNFAKAERLFLEGKYGDVVACANTLIDERASQRDEIYYIRGLSELKLKRFDDARQSFQYIVDHYPRSKRALDAYTGIGDAYLLAGDPGAAITAYNEALRRFPKDKNISVVRDRVRLAGTSPAIKRVPDTAKAPSAPRGIEPKVASAPAISVPKKRPQVTVVIPPPAPQKEYDVVIQSSGNFSVQAGCFKSKRNAERLARRLAAMGYQSHIAIPVTTDDNLYRVKVGKGLSQQEAEALASRLKRSGYSTKLCNGEVCQ